MKFSAYSPTTAFQGCGVKPLVMSETTLDYHNNLCQSKFDKSDSSKSCGRKGINYGTPFVGNSVPALYKYIFCVHKMYQTNKLWHLIK